MANPSRRKKPSIKDEAIDVNELAEMSNMKGLLSFLDTQPEDYARLFNKTVDFPASHHETGAPDSVHNNQNPDGLATTGAPITGAPIKAPVAETGAPVSEAPILETSASDIGVPVLEPEAPETGAPVLETGAAETGAPVIDESLEAAETGAPVTRAPFTETEAPITEAPVIETGAPKTEAPVLDSYRHVVVRSPRPWVNVQDGLSHGEERTYRAIFTHGKPYGSNGARALCIGDRQLSSLAGLSYSNTHASIRTLAEKLAIEIHPADHRNAGKLLIAFPYTEIMRRWRAAGLTHVLKLSRGVWLKTGAPVSGAPVLETGAPDAETSAPVPGKTGAPVSGASIRNKEGDSGIDDIIREHLWLTGRTFGSNRSDWPAYDDVKHIPLNTIIAGMLWTAFNHRKQNRQAPISSFAFFCPQIQEFASQPDKMPESGWAEHAREKLRQEKMVPETWGREDQ